MRRIGLDVSTSLAAVEDIIRRISDQPRARLPARQGQIPNCQRVRLESSQRLLLGDVHLVVSRGVDDQVRAAGGDHLFHSLAIGHVQRLTIVALHRESALLKDTAEFDPELTPASEHQDFLLLHFQLAAYKMQSSGADRLRSALRCAAGAFADQLSPETQQAFEPGEHLIHQDLDLPGSLADGREADDLAQEERVVILDAHRTGNQRLTREFESQSFVMKCLKRAGKRLRRSRAVGSGFEGGGFDWAVHSLLIGSWPGNIRPRTNFLPPPAKTAWQVEKWLHFRGYTQRMRVSIAEAKNSLTRLVHAAEKGERITICRHGVPVADLVPSKEAPLESRRFGTLKAAPGL